MARRQEALPECVYQDEVGVRGKTEDADCADCGDESRTGGAEEGAESRREENVSIRNTDIGTK